MLFRLTFREICLTYDFGVGDSLARANYDLIRNLLSAHDYLRDALNLTIREVDPGSFSVSGFDIDAIETHHVMYCLAYRITPAGMDAPSITFSGDSEATADVTKFADGSNVLIHDCTYPDDSPNSLHAAPFELGRVLDGVRIDCTYLTHLVPETDGQHDEMLESINKSYDGDVCIAHDGLEIDIN